MLRLTTQLRTLHLTHWVLQLTMEGNITNTTYYNTTMISPNTSSNVIIVNPDVECMDFLFIIYVVIFGPICAFGIVGNVLSVVVMQWEKKNHVATFLLQSLAMADNLFLLTTGFVQIYSALTLYFGYDDVWITPYLQTYVWPLVHMTQLGTIYMTVLIAANRYIAICRPFQASTLCTLTKVRLQVAIMSAFCFLYCIPRFLEYQLGEEFSPHDNRTYPRAIPFLVQDKLYNIIYENVLYCLFVFLGPLVILVFLNACLIRELWRSRRRLSQQLPGQSDDEETNITQVMIFIMLIFVVCQAPAFLNQLLNYTETYACHQPYLYYFHLSNLLVSANSATNFIVYCAFRKQFRERLKAFCRRDRMALKYTDSVYTYDGRTASLYATRNGRNADHV